MGHEGRCIFRAKTRIGGIPLNVGYKEWRVHLLEQSVTKLAPIGEQVSARFYDTLFKDCPSVRPLFQNVSRQDQHKKFWGALTLIVRGFRHQPEQLTKDLQTLGLRHKAYGVRPEDYDTVRVILLKVLKEVLSEIWSAEMHLAWSLAIFDASQSMLQGARQAATKNLSNPG